ncbi:MAG: putative molybdenum carrier protein [Syntrophales bacterium]
MIQKIISGGQTGADRAALDFAIKHKIPYGGWVPKGRKAEDGLLPEKYHLQEMPTGSYIKRTEQNVLDSDGTLIISHGLLTGGSARTRELAKQRRKPWLHINLEATPCPASARMIQEWVEQHNIKTMNVAGARASKDPMIYQAVLDLLEACIVKYA